MEEGQAHIPEQAAEVSPPAPTAHDLRREAVYFAKIVVLVLLLVLMFRTFVMESWPVQGPSMMPTLQDKERILVLKLPALLSRLPLFSGIEPFKPRDLVVFVNTKEGNRRYIKRVIAEGPPWSEGNVVNARPIEGSAAQTGVSVRFDMGTLYVNNRRLDEPYLVPEEKKSPDTDHRRLQAGEYYVLGDHRSVSKDSRRIGPVRHEQVIGKAIAVLWPPSRIRLL